MQFYIIHEDPKRNAELLPDYCLKQVNVREGYQILSDIGHIYGVTWDGQNKCYSKSHPTTRMHGASYETFLRFTDYYMLGLLEYRKRYDKETSFHRKYASFSLHAFDRLAALMIRDTTTYQDTIHYLLTEKRDKLTPEEITRLEGELKCTNN